MTGAGPVDRARDRLAELLAAIGAPAQPTDDGGFVVPHGPATVTIALSEVDGLAVLDVWAAVVDDTALSADLFRYAAETSYLFGRLCVARTGDGRGQLQLCHTALAEPLDEDVVVQYLGTVAETAVELRHRLADRFGAT